MGASTLKIVEQQLLHSLRETPVETDCSISVALLRLLQLVTADDQRAWLDRHRAPQEGKSWRCIEERWVYTALPVEEEEPRRPDAPLFPRAILPQRKSAPPAPAAPAPKAARMVVKPVRPLPGAGRSSSSPA